MIVLVDTPVWSLAYRRKRASAAERRIVDELRKLIRRNEAVMMGAIRQEVLSGIRDATQFTILRATLRAFSDLPVTTDDHEQAAQLFNRCQTTGVQGSHIDFLICAVALRYNASVFTTDKDFQNYVQHTKNRLHVPRAVP